MFFLAISMMHAVKLFFGLSQGNVHLPIRATPEGEHGIKGSQFDFTELLRDRVKSRLVICDCNLIYCGHIMHTTHSNLKHTNMKCMFYANLLTIHHLSIMKLRSKYH